MRRWAGCVCGGRVQGREQREGGCCDGVEAEGAAHVQMGRFSEVGEGGVWWGGAGLRALNAFDEAGAACAQVGRYQCGRGSLWAGGQVAGVTVWDGVGGELSKGWVSPGDGAQGGSDGGRLDSG